VKPITEDIVLIDDTYNANPPAFKASLEAFAAFPAERRLLVCGDMLELGEESARYHLELGRWIARQDAFCAVVGVGIHVASCPRDTAFPATSLADTGAGAVEAATVLEAFCRQFLTWVNRWLDEGFPPLRQAWLVRAKGVGAPIEVRLGDGSTLEGVFEGLDEGGALLLKTADGVRSIDHGDVFFAAAADR
ncbi:MAG: hypothetical protein IIA70_09150, partial [Proteobacteria bacterium]|nr:hypothetical protein [Pseudomonadota bacterium]